MKGKGRKGELEGAEREKKNPTIAFCWEQSEEGFSWRAPRFLGTQRAVWRETSELEAGLNTLSPRKLGGNKGGAEAFSPEASGAFSWAGSLPGRRGNSLQRDYLPVLSISSAKSTLRAQSSSLNSLNNWPPPGLRWRFSITGIRKVTSCFRPRLLCYSWKGG